MPKNFEQSGASSESTGSEWDVLKPENNDFESGEAEDSSDTEKSSETKQASTMEESSATDLTAEQTIEKPALDPESLKDIDQLQDQLEQIGVNEKILTNPAFQRELSKIISGYGLTMAHDVAADSESNNLTLHCQGEHGDSREHDRSFFDFNVDEDGHLTLTTACADCDTNKKFDRKLFPSVSAPETEQYLDCAEHQNHSALVEFSLTEDGEGLQIDTTDILETQYTPLGTPNNDFKNGLYSISRKESSSVFDAEGKEQFREAKLYESANLSLNYLPHTLGKTLTKIDHTSAQELTNPSRPTKKNIIHRETLHRNPDGTINVDIYSSQDGTTNIEKCPMNTQYGDDELIPDSGTVQEALFAQRSEQNQ